MQQQIIITCQQGTTGNQGSCATGYVEQPLNAYVVTETDSFDYLTASGFFSFGLFTVVFFYVLGKSLGSFIKIVK